MKTTLYRTLRGEVQKTSLFGALFPLYLGHCARAVRLLPIATLMVIVNDDWAFARRIHISPQI
jgi:hypothetical protein